MENMYALLSSLNARGEIISNATVLDAVSYTYDANNRLLTYNGYPLTYDANGNLLSRQTAQGPVNYTWNAQNQLTGIRGPNGTASFIYDAFGRRIGKTVNGLTTAFLYDGDQAIAEWQGPGIGTTYVTGLRIDEVLARYGGQGNRTYLSDALGSVLATLLTHGGLRKLVLVHRASLARGASGEGKCIQMTHSIWGCPVYLALRGL
ncbi:MAG: RHS repeat protein [Gammaproteobacteria bacterium]|nr:RHS repeat protein [Gammaproteobacteria bacterium]